MKVKNRLLNFSNNIIYQNDDYFAFSIDSVLLANFVTIKLSDKKIVDFCSGNAPIPMLMSFRTGLFGSYPNVMFLKSIPFSIDVNILASFGVVKVDFFSNRVKIRSIAINEY